MSGKPRACGCLRCSQLWGRWRQDLPGCCSSPLWAAPSLSLQMTLCSLRWTSNLWITAGVWPLCSVSLSRGLSSTWPSLSHPQVSERKINNQWSCCQIDEQELRMFDGKSFSERRCSLPADTCSRGDFTPVIRISLYGCKEFVTFLISHQKNPKNNYFRINHLSRVTEKKSSGSNIFLLLLHQLEWCLVDCWVSWWNFIFLRVFSCKKNIGSSNFKWRIFERYLSLEFLNYV